MKTLIASAALMGALATPATAATLIYDNGSAASFAAPAGGTVIDFNGSTPAGFQLNLGNAAAIVQGNAPTHAEPAFSDGSRYLAVGAGGVATLSSIAEGYQSVSFFIGSIDSYNTVEVFGTAGELIASYTGADFTVNPNGDQGLPVTNRRITITRDATDALIGSVRFLSTTPALEVDNVVFTAVPEPSTWALMFLGFAMVGTATRYRSRSRRVVYG